MRLLSHWPQNRWLSHLVLGPGRAGAEEARRDLARAHSPAPRTKLFSALLPSLSDTIPAHRSTRVLASAQLSWASATLPCSAREVSVGDGTLRVES
jgi:hypothetical protein